ncbi:MAG TPA: ABC transporter substrate-binding protein [Chloroflexia bacterium]|nr:ABC transporter substrate-binding protein [Chloroflexia bacterium]
MFIKKVSKRLTLLTALTLVLTLLLLACGDATSTTAPAATTAAATTVANVTTAVATTAATTAASATTAAATTAAATTGSTVPGFSVVNTKVAATLKTGPGVDQATRTIKVGALFPLSGPVGPYGKIQLAAVETYFKALNEAGGIGGYKVEVVSGDTAYQPQQAVQQYNKIAPDVAMFSVILGTPIVQALKDQITSEKIIAGASTFDSSILFEKYVYIQATPYPIEAINGIDFAVRQLNGKSKKFALVYQDDGYGADAIKGYNTAIKAYGLTDVGQLPFKVGDATFTAQATQLKNNGAEIVLLASQPSETAKIIGAASQLGVNAKYLLMSPAFTSSLLATPVKDVLVADSYFVSKGTSWGDPNVPGWAPMLSALAKYVPDQKPSNWYSFGWIQAIITANILAKALEQGDISRDGLFKALESSKNIDLAGLLPNASYGSTPDERIPSRETTVFRLDTAAPDGTVVVDKSFASDLAKSFKLGS